jgi:flagellar basal body-associated protein FliL
MTYSVRNIVIALVLAAVAAGLVILYTGNVQKQAHNSQQNVTVVVAKSAIAAAVPSRISSTRTRSRRARSSSATSCRVHTPRLAR